MGAEAYVRLEIGRQPQGHFTIHRREGERHAVSNRGDVGMDFAVHRFHQRTGRDVRQTHFTVQALDLKIARHTAEYGMVYEAGPPYTVLQTGAVDAATMQRFTRFSRYWELVANSGRFKQTLSMLLGEDAHATADAEARAKAAAPSPFHAFLAFADWLWQSTGKTSGLSPEALVDALFDYLCLQRGLPAPIMQKTLLADYVASGARASPQALQGLLPKRDAPAKTDARTLAQRQERHLSAQQSVPDRDG